MSCDPSKICPLCDQKGLPILPLRYAVARTDLVQDSVRAPSLQSPFSAGGVSLPPEQAQYTLRLLRGGYLYVFNEKRNEWKAYVVSDDAHLVEFDVYGKAPPQMEDAEPCARMMQGQTGRCVMIPGAHDPSKLGKVWMSFSEVAWTQKVLERHSSSQYRGKHMQCIDAAAWVTSNGQAEQPHVASYYGADDRVAEFKLAAGYSVDGADGTETLARVQAVVGHSAFGHSMVDLLSFDKNRLGALRSTIQHAAGNISPEQPGVPPAIVALADPTGVATDLNALVNERVREWTEDYDRKDRYETALAITALREAVGNGAVMRKEQINRAVATGGYALGSILAPNTMSGLARKPGHWGNVGEIEDDEEKQRLGEEAWDKYADMLKSESEYKKYLDEVYPAELEAFETAVVKPLDTSYTGWLKSPEFANYFICNFDTTDVHSGLAFTQAFAVTIMDAGGRRSACEHLNACLREDATKPESIALRALVWNQDQAVKEWQAAVEKSGAEVDWNGVAGGVYAGLKDVLEKGGSGELDGPFGAVAKYAYQISGPVSQALGELFNQGASATSALLPHRMLMGLVGAVAKAGNPNLEIVDVTMATDIKTARKQIARALSVMSGVDEQGLRAGAGRDMREFADRNAKRVPLRMVMLVDEQRARLMRRMDLGSRANRGTRERYLSKILEPQDFDLLVTRSIKRLGSFEFKANLVGTMFATVSLGKLADEVAKAAKGERWFKTANFAAGVYGVSGAAIETTASLAKNTRWGASKLARPMGALMLRAETAAELWVARGKWLGAIGGWLAGGMMIYEGVEERGVNKLYGNTMIILGVGTVVLAFLALFGVLAGVSLVLAIVFAIVAVGIAFIKPDKAHHWLDKSMIFGKHGSGEFTDLEAQQDALSALGAG